MKLSIDEIKSIIPHRDPFLFLDKIESVVHPLDDENGDEISYQGRDSEGLKVTASYHVSEDLSIFKGHFPGNPVLPGVIQIEMMAQASIFVLLRRFNRTELKDLEVALCSVERSRFRRPVKPGMDLTIVSELLRVRGKILSFTGLIKADDKVMAEATFMASFNMNNG